MSSVSRCAVLNVVNSCIDMVDGSRLSIEDIDKDISECGIDSIIFIQLIILLEDEFGIEIPDSELIYAKLNTVHKIADMLDNIIHLSKQS